MKNQAHRCQHCGASLKAYWHKVTPGLVSALLKINKAVNMKKKNDIMIDKLPELIALTHVERCNWQKLRLHGLIARVKEGGEVKRGRWLITRKGHDFLSGHQISESVKSFRNRVVGHSANLITISEALESTPYFEEINDISFEYTTPTEEGDDETDTPILKTKKTRLKRGQTPCPECGEPLKSRFQDEPGEQPNSLKVTRWKECTECGYKEEAV